MVDVFISYSRRDQAFVRSFHAALVARGREVWIDWEDIPPTADWEAEIYAGIEAADAFVFVLSPDSVRSDVCPRELEHAVHHQKRLVPVVCRAVDPKDVPPALAALNWIFWRGDDVGPTVDAVLAAIDTDLDRVRLHTRLLTRALEWERRGRDASLLLRGSDLREAEQWLLVAGEREPRPTPLQTQYLLVSRRGETARQRLLLGGVTVALVVALALGALAWLQRSEAVTAQAKAERRFNDVRQLANAFMFEFHDAVANLPGATPARRLVTERALEYLDGLAEEAGGDPALQRELLIAYNRVGDVQGNPNTSNLGDLAGALESYRRSLEIAERLAAADPNGAKAQRDLAVGYGKIAQVQNAAGDVAGSLASHRRALAIYEHLAQADPDNLQAQRDLAFGLRQVGDVEGNPGTPNVGNLAGALESFERALVIDERVVAADPSDATAQRDLAMGHNKLGDVQQASGDLVGAEKSYRRALTIDEDLVATHPNNLEYRRDLSISYGRVGELQQQAGDLTAALESFRHGLEIAEGLVRIDANDTRAQADLANSLDRLGRLWRASGEISRALENQRRALEISERLAAADPGNKVSQRGVAWRLWSIADTYLAGGDPAAALENYRRSLEIDERLAAADPGDTRAQRDVAVDYASISGAQWAAGDHASALESRRRARELYERLLGSDPDNPRARASLATEYSAVCRLGALAGRAAEVLAECDRAVALVPENGSVRDSRGIARALLGDASGAIEDFTAFVEWAEPRAPGAQLIGKRRAWIAALEGGRDPFNDAALAELRAE